VSSTLFHPATGVVGLVLTAWLLALGGIAAWRRQGVAACSFLASSPVAAVCGWSFIRDTKVWRQESAELPFGAYYSVLSAMLISLMLALVAYAILRRDPEQAGPSGAAWMLPATGAAWLATGALLLDVAATQGQLPRFLAVICGTLALSLVALTAINGAKAWGNYRHRGAK
jgi:hypothetical protein